MVSLMDMVRKITRMEMVNLLVFMMVNFWMVWKVGKVKCHMLVWVVMRVNLKMVRVMDRVNLIVA